MATKKLGKYSIESTVHVSKSGTERLMSVDNRDATHAPITPTVTAYTELSTWAETHGFTDDAGKSRVRECARNGELPNTKLQFGTWIIANDQHDVPDTLLNVSSRSRRDDGRNKFALYLNTTSESGAMSEYDAFIAAMTAAGFDVNNLVVNPRDK